MSDIASYLARVPGPGNPEPPDRREALEKAAERIEQWFRDIGCVPRPDPYRAHGHTLRNIEVEFPGATGSVLVIGAHYDTGSPGANDNASGVAVLLALAERLTHFIPELTLRLVAFSSEEPPFTHTDELGSRVYAKRCQENHDHIAGMVSLECLGHFGRRGKKPLRVIGNLHSRRLCRDLAKGLRRSGPVRRWTLPGFVPGVRSSDHWSFWQEGWPAVMVSDGGPLRTRHRHRRTGTVDTLDFERMERIADALARWLH